MTRNTYITITKSSYDKLIRQANYISSSRQSYTLIALYLNRENDITEKEIEDYLNEIDEADEKESFYIKITPEMQNEYKSKKRYMFSFNQLISVFIYRFLLFNDLPETEDKVDNKLKGFTLPLKTIEKLEELSKSIGSNQSTLINFGLANFDSEQLPKKNLSNEEKKKYLGIAYPLLDKIPHTKTEKIALIDKILFNMKL